MKKTSERREARAGARPSTDGGRIAWSRAEQSGAEVAGALRVAERRPHCKGENQTPLHPRRESSIRYSFSYPGRRFLSEEAPRRRRKKAMGTGTESESSSGGAAGRARGLALKALLLLGGALLLRRMRKSTTRWDHAHAVANSLSGEKVLPI
ncbi:hypothetical protein GW17_00008651 [Ensete ventricosum]|nr:hypothetical protein GW17_00008651 [Ensete ventricosum]